MVIRRILNFLKIKPKELARRSESIGAFAEVDVVRLIEELPGIPAGATGTIVMAYGKSGQYEVEFVDDDGNTIAIETVSGERLELIQQHR